MVHFFPSNIKASIIRRGDLVFSKIARLFLGGLTECTIVIWLAKILGDLD